MMYKGLSLLTNSESPVVVVLSFVHLRPCFWIPTPRAKSISDDSYRGSMEPAFYRGDVLFLTNPAKYEIGDVRILLVNTMYIASSLHSFNR